MSNQKLFLTNTECLTAAGHMAQHLKALFRSGGGSVRIHGVPRGGVPVSYLVKGFHPDFIIVDNPDKADVFVDDIVDSGKTKRFFIDKHGRPFHSLVDFMELPEPCPWIVFPWEQGLTGEDTSAEDFVTRLLQYVGEDPQREGLKETPQRVLKAWKDWTSGYGMDPKTILKCFEDGSENYDEMVVVKDLPFYSHCEHHLAPFFGTATIAYIPNKRIVGLSKLGRLLELFARRLQVQERLTVQIATALQQVLEPRGVAVMIKARHLCMESRGLNRQGHHTVTSALRGVFLEDKVRAEFMSMVK